MRILVIQFFIFFAITSGQQSNFVKVQDKFLKAQSLSADFIQKYRTFNSADFHTISGKIYLKKNNKFRVELKANTIVSDGETVWNYNEKNNQVVINYLDDMDQVFDIEKLLDSFSDDYKIVEDSVKKNITCYSQNPDQRFKKVVIEYNSKFLINGMELTDSMNNFFKIELKNIKIDRKLKDSFFKFLPPEGSRIVDLR